MSKVIVNEVMDAFFQGWGDRVINWLADMKEKYNADRKEMSAQFAHEIGYTRAHSEAYKAVESKWADALGKGNFDLIKHYPVYTHPTISGSIEKTVRKSMEAKKIGFYAKVEKKVGEVTEINLHVGQDGTPNGSVKGTNGSCYVETIVAGGWNIQCLHYRVLVK